MGDGALGGMFGAGGAGHSASMRLAATMGKLWMHRQKPSGEIVEVVGDDLHGAPTVANVSKLKIGVYIVGVPTDIR